MNPMYYIRKDYARKPVVYDFKGNRALRKFARIKLIIGLINATVSVIVLLAAFGGVL